MERDRAACGDRRAQPWPRIPQCAVQFVEPCLLRRAAGIRLATVLVAICGVLHARHGVGGGRRLSTLSATDLAYSLAALADGALAQGLAQPSSLLSHPDRPVDDRQPRPAYRRRSR